MLLREIAVQLFEHLIDHSYHGYSQMSRWGDGEGTCDINIDGKVYKLEQGDRDCSSAIISAYEAAGISCGGATYTGNMRSCMAGTGNFVWHPMSSGYVAQRGDVYLNEVSHTAMCLSAVPDMLGEFSISETGGIDGAEGDQTGGESAARSYYNYPWDGILQCVATGEAKTPEKQMAGWIWDGKERKWWYRHKDGGYTSSGWEKVDEKWYYFDRAGWMLYSVFVTTDKHTYYVGKDGAMLTGWQIIEKDWYYFSVESPVGHMIMEDFVEHKCQKCYLKKSGKMARNETITIQTSDGTTEYAFGHDGYIVGQKNK